MEAFLDPIHLLICGGAGVGKTTLLSRISGFRIIPFEHEYSPTLGVNRTTFDIPMINNLTLKLIIYDISAYYLSRPILPDNLQAIFRCCEGALIVTDPLRTVCATWTDVALDLISKYGNHRIPAYLLVNKADLDQKYHVFSSNQLDAFIAGNEQIFNWYYTVGHPHLGDVDSSRGCSFRQQSIEGIVGKLVSLALIRRHKFLPKLLALPMNLRFESLDHMSLDKIEPFHR